ncbi:hypothetical protein O7635_36260 [Asanoa sp. WMMD1127]|uniref:hypothetical protein n=1 Tax=Asanoa sp. WMMD1127 TaxID=3016107 RepID=UPI002416D9E7|nr:hypothetical protein [Asanoa sp. WMMD1127]MDG4827329.1 hypothetical protein [Asanoa sp. WMMD1127]
MATEIVTAGLCQAAPIPATSSHTRKSTPVASAACPVTLAIDFPSWKVVDFPLWKTMLRSGLRLAAVDDARAAVADRLVTPWWYHPALGILLAGYVVGISFGNSGVKIASGLLFAAAVVALGNLYRRRTGVWVSGFQAGRASRWAIALGVLIGAVVLTAWAIGSYTRLDWPVWVLAAVGFVGTVLIGRRFDSALRAQLRAAG